jgi:hypothetical protein
MTIINAGESKESLSCNVSVWLLFTQKLKNSVALVRKRTIPTERPPLVVEISANLCG